MVAQALSLKLFTWELPSGCGTMAQNLQDPVATVSVKSTSFVLNTIRPIAGGQLVLPHSGLQDPGPQEPKVTIPPVCCSPTTPCHLNPQRRRAHSTCARGPGEVAGARPARHKLQHPAPRAQCTQAPRSHHPARLPPLLTSPSSRHTMLLLFNFAEHPVPTPC